ncbi:transporter substrate-binding domain-containing protein [Kineococcus endophyticus]|uniref:Transporter substrate-binding domain-containing protein n=1 Tax=Kineococcus endophyticus TaxID=1181883 RepID=A0ABV3P914_9ACTN
MRRRRPLAVLAAAAAVTALAAGCGSQAGTTTTAGSAAGAPAGLSLVADGVLTIGTDPTYPPMEYEEGGTLKGANVEILTDVARRLGLRPQFQTVAFADLRPAAAAHTIDVVGASVTDKAVRQKDVDFVDVFYAGEQIIAGTGDHSAWTTPGNWCGLRIAATAGTSTSDIVTGQSALCTAVGKPPVTLVDVPYLKSVEEVRAGRADLGAEGLPAAAKLIADSGGTLQAVGKPWQAQPWGYGFAKDRTALRDAVQQALQAAIADGTYDAILEEYGVSDGALHTTAVNGGA